MPVSGTGMSIISQNVWDILFSPQLITNLLSVSNLADNNYQVSFSHDGCHTQDKETGRPIMRDVEMAKWETVYRGFASSCSYFSFQSFRFQKKKSSFIYGIID